MAYNKRTIRLILFALIAVVAIVGCDVSGADLDLDLDTAVPTVSSTLPANQATNVAVDAAITATFNEAMDSATITATSFTLSAAGAAIAGTVSYDAEALVARFHPEGNLEAGVSYTATITDSVGDEAGNVLVDNKIWNFTIATPVDTTAPMVTSTRSADQATNVAIDSEITATFSEAMDSATITATSFTLSSGSGAVAGTVSYDAATTTAKFVPTANLEVGTSYMVTIASTVTDEAGNAMLENKVWSFTSATAVDTTPPTVTSTIPVHEATNVAITSDITAVFSEAMDSATLTGTSFTLSSGTGAVSGTVSYDAVTFTAKFRPASSLAAGVTYTATIANTAKDAVGNAMAQNKIWTFTTVAPEDLGAGPDGGPEAVNLGNAANYAILAESGVSTTGDTVVTGDIGLSPSPGTSLTGFSNAMDVSNVWSTSDYVVGKFFAANYEVPTPSTLTTAIGDMRTAYTAAAGLPTPDFSDLGAGEIGGLTLEPGLYKWGTGVTITTDVTLFGSSTATWVFQIAETLSVANGIQVILTGGALPENIVWQVGTQATLGTTSKMAGILLAKTAIDVQTSASVNGRLFAQTAVTLDANAVTEP